MGKTEVKEEFSCAVYSPEYFMLCAAGGALACGTTHFALTPLDLVKCRLQVDHAKYKSIANGFKVSWAEGGFKNVTKGWLPTMIGYSLQGLGKFAGYEYFKHLYADIAGPEKAYLYQTALYLAASASAEFLIADVLLAPFEATKVRMQTTPGYTSSMFRAMARMKAQEGIGTFYKGLPPLWGRQVPYTMMKFASFEKVIVLLYDNFVPKKREDCTKGEQLVVTFAAGYIAGVFCAIVSHPADTIVSKLNKDPTSSVGGIVSSLGFVGIWRGLIARIIMIGTLTALQWFVYDAFKVYTRMPRPLPPEMPESLKKKK